MRGVGRPASELERGRALWRVREPEQSLRPTQCGPSIPALNRRATCRVFASGCDSKYRIREDGWKSATLSKCCPEGCDLRQATGPMRLRCPDRRNSSIAAVDL